MTQPLWASHLKPARTTVQYVLLESEPHGQFVQVMVLVEKINFFYKVPNYFLCFGV